ncbi:MAG: hypothetical protein AAGC60_18360 [Acidobacteriota bacterium]
MRVSAPLRVPASAVVFAAIACAAYLGLDALTPAPTFAQTLDTRETTRPAGPSTESQQPAGSEPTEVQQVDRIVALVDEDPIFESDLARARALDADAAELPRDDLLRRVIDERLRAHEVERAEIPPVAGDEVAAQVARIAARFGGLESMRESHRALGLDSAGLRLLVRRQLRLLAYIDERLAPRVFITPQDIEAYYSGPLTVAMAERGEPLPPLEAVRDAIATLLSERALSREIDAWTERLRERATIRTFERADTLPPVRLVIEAGATSEPSAQQPPKLPHDD